MKQKFKLLSAIMIFSIATIMDATAQNIQGPSTLNYMVKFLNTSPTAPTAGSSLIYDSGTNVGIATTTLNNRLEVNGNVNVLSTYGYRIDNRLIFGYTNDNLRAGYEAGLNTVVTYNTFAGEMAGRNNTYATHNVVLGNRALYTQSYTNANTQYASNNVAIGNSALYSNQPTSTSNGINNTVVGYNAGYSNTTGTGNSVNGFTALYSNTTGNYNTANGRQSMYSNTTGANNAAYGTNSLVYNTSGNYNTANGVNSLFYNTTGYDNSANGNQALYNNSTGYANTASGYQALLGNTTGFFNSAVGFYAGLTNTTGSTNTCIGYAADVSTGTLTNATAIGNGAIVNASNKVRIGNTYATIVIEGQTAWTYPSDGRFKNNITENVKGLEFIKKLRPVNYKFNTQTFDQFLMQNMTDSIKALRTNGVDYTASSSVIHTGFIAQEVEQAANACGYIFDGLHVPVDANDNYSLGYSQFVVPLVKAVQELSKAADSTNTAIAKKDSINDAKIQAMQNKINQLDTIINSCCTAGKSMQQNNSNSESLTNSKDVELSNKNIVVLDQNTPNPFADQTLINYFLPDNITRAQIIFLDQSGKLIKAVDLTEKGKGSLNVFASDLTSGIYTYSLIVDGQTIETKRMVKTK